MLKTRILTALALLGFLIPTLFRAPQWAWVLVGTVIVTAAAWEWGGLLQAGSLKRNGFAALTALLCLGLAWIDPAAAGFHADGATPYAILHGGTINRPLYGLGVFFWCGMMPLWLRHKWVLGDTVLGWSMGWVVLIPAWLALVHLRAVDVPLLLAVLAIAWVADVAAYFAGKRWGRHKLAPSISPGKTWEGAAGALVGILVFGGILSMTTVYPLPVIPTVLALCLLTAVSIMGDLFESLIKRQAGLKDSSQLLPGHGGVLDRVDSLTSTLPLSAALLLLFFP